MNTARCQVSKLSKKGFISTIFTIDRPEACRARADELIALTREQIKVLEIKHEEFFTWTDFINTKTEKLLSKEYDKEIFKKGPRKNYC